MNYRFYLSLPILFFILILIPLGHAKSHHPQKFLQAIRGTKNEGKQIYRHFCSQCHAPNPVIPLGAPRKGNPDDWALRVKQDISILFKHTDEGFNAMPPRGGCFECTDEQLLLAIITLIPNLQNMKHGE